MKTPKRLPRPCPRVRGNDNRGEWAEAAFLAEALARGFTVCRPFSNTRRFDFVLFSEANEVVRVQIKSSWRKYPNQGYRLALEHRGRRYRASEVDFLVAYIVPEDVWYIIPIAEVTRRNAVAFFPYKPGSRSRWERYRGAWHLLTLIVSDGRRFATKQKRRPDRRL